jgi:hypothetical protein
MQESLVIRCQCRPGCAGWIRVQEVDQDLIGTPGTRLVLPGHACADDRIYEIHSGYLVVASPRPPMPI